MSENLTWKRDGRGRQVSTDGRYAVQSDGYERGQHVGAQGDWKNGAPGSYEGFVGGEWAAILDPNGKDENLDWFPTMREAKARCERHAEARIQRIAYLQRTLADAQRRAQIAGTERVAGRITKSCHREAVAARDKVQAALNAELQS